MKIHSSSLSFPPNPNQKIGRNSTAPNKDNNELPATKKPEPQKVNQPSTPEAIKKTLATVKSDVNLSNNINKPTSSLAQKALSAYNQQFNAPQHEQRANLISGIDTYA